MNEIEVIRPDPEAVRKEAEKERLLSEKRREHTVVLQERLDNEIKTRYLKELLSDLEKQKQEIDEREGKLRTEMEQIWLEKGRDGESFPLEACQKDFDSF